MSEKKESVSIEARVEGNRRWSMFALKIAIIGAAIGMVAVGLSLWALSIAID